jgi:hypothetical protein
MKPHEKDHSIMVTAAELLKRAGYDEMAVDDKGQPIILWEGGRYTAYAYVTAWEPETGDALTELAV